MPVRVILEVARAQRRGDSNPASESPAAAAATVTDAVPLTRAAHDLDRIAARPRGGGQVYRPVAVTCPAGSAGERPTR